MKRYDSLETLFGNVVLSFVETLLDESYHLKDSCGRPPPSPLGVFKVLLIMRLRHVPSGRMLASFMFNYFSASSKLLGT
jgi:hypothetical protein